MGFGYLHEKQFKARKYPVLYFKYMKAYAAEMKNTHIYQERNKPEAQDIEGKKNDFGQRHYDIYDQCEYEGGKNKRAKVRRKYKSPVP